MDFNLSLLSQNLTNPALLFFILGIIAVRVKSDLELPENTSKFISMYLLLAIGFKGGQELSHSIINREIIWLCVAGVISALAIPIYTFFILRLKIDTPSAGAIAASYGSVSAVTFVTALAFLESLSIPYGGHMVAVMAMMEVPSIIIGVILVKQFGGSDLAKVNYLGLFKNAFTNGSVLLISGSLVIGYLASEEQAAGIKPFTTDIFKGFLAVFLLDKGIASGKKLKAFINNGWFAGSFAVVIPLINGILASLVSAHISTNVGDRLLLAILAASASYIAVPAAMKQAVPKANAGLYLPMALAVTFPINITLGLPLYLAIIQFTT